MQVKTYIYGTPLGFNFYEDDSQYKDYFKAFYISSREGRRLMVNRLDNGETSYNFLCYRIAEFGNRPNAFFGMSLVLGDYVYCADFGKLYNWFNFLFDKLVDERNLISKTDSGLRYGVSKFIEGTQDVEWLKSNLPNILSSPGMKLFKYDSSFSDKKTGKIMLVNPDDKPESLLNAFKQNRWICLTPFVASENDCPELDYGEMSSFLDGVTKQLLPIAINPEEKYIPLLKKIYTETKENSQSISEYLEKSRDEENKKLFSELGKRYYDILTQQLPKIAEKIKDEGKQEPVAPPSSASPVPPKTKKCTQCGKQKPVSAFADGDDVCLECRNHTNSRLRKCKNCGKEKSIGDFEGNDTVCRQCRNNEDSSHTKRPKYLYAAIAALILLIVAGVVVFIPKGGDEKIGGENTGNAGIVQNNKVNVAEYEDFIKNHQFVEAYEYINGKENQDEYTLKLKENLEKYLITLSYDDIDFTIVTVNKINLCYFVVINENEWLDYASTGPVIDETLKKAQLTSTEKKSCQTRINKFKRTNIFKQQIEAWEALLNSKTVLSVTPPPPSPPAPAQFKIEYRKNDGEMIPITGNKPKGIECRAGEYVDIYQLKKKPVCVKGDFESKGGKIGDHSNETPPYYRIVTKSHGTFVFLCDEIELTITVKRGRQ